MRTKAKKLVMKISQIFLCVIGLHLLVIATLLVTPGCSVFEDEETTGSEGVVGTPDSTEPSRANENYQPAQYAAPAEPDSSAAVSRPRYPPTRPTWNLNASQPAEVIQGTDVSVLEPVDADSFDAPLSPVAGTSSTYVVKKGDNLTVIARRHDVTLKELMAANNLNKNSVLQIGQVLTIPAGGAMDYAPPASGPISASAGSVDVGGTTYKVQPGDNLSSLAKRYGTTVSAIRSANNLSSDTIYVDQELLIPSGSGSTYAPAPSSSVTAPSSLNKPASTTNNAGETVHTVRAGETLGIIARRYNVKVSDLMERNGITDPKRLAIGTVLVISSDSAAPSGVRTTKPAPVSAPRAPAAPVAPAPGGTLEEFDAQILLENLDEIPAAEVQSAN